MFVNFNIPSFREFLRKYVYNFRNKLETSDNVIIRRIYFIDLFNITYGENATVHKLKTTTKTPYSQRQK